jgi:hypothetical protein
LDLEYRDLNPLIKPPPIRQNRQVALAYVLRPPRGRQRSAASADEYALSTEVYLTGLITAEEKYEKDFRIPDTRRFHSERRDRLRLCEKPGGRFDGKDGD